MRKVIGYSLLSLPFVGITIDSIVTLGIVRTLLGIGALVLLMLVLGAGLYLVTEQK